MLGELMAIGMSFEGSENVLKLIVVMAAHLNRLKITGLYALNG